MVVYLQAIRNGGYKEMTKAKTVMLLVLAAMLICFATGFIQEELVFAKMHSHPLGKVQTYDDYEVIPLGSGRRLCVLKRGDSVIVADMPGKGKGHYYERGNLSWRDDLYELIGVSSDYILIMGDDEILCGTRCDRWWGTIQSAQTLVPGYKLHFWDRWIMITPQNNSF